MHPTVTHSKPQVFTPKIPSLIKCAECLREKEKKKKKTDKTLCHQRFQMALEPSDAPTVRLHGAVMLQLLDCRVLSGTVR